MKDLVQTPDKLLFRNVFQCCLADTNPFPTPAQITHPCPYWSNVQPLESLLMCHDLNPNAIHCLSSHNIQYLMTLPGAQARNLTLQPFEIARLKPTQESWLKW